MKLVVAEKPSVATVKGFGQSMRQISFCIRRRRNTLTVGQSQSCREYKQVRAEMKELHNVRTNVEYLLDIPVGQEALRKEERNRQ